MQEKRQHIRTRVSLTTEIIHPVLGTVTLLTRDISDQGMYLVVGGTPIPPVGDIVDVQVVGIVDKPPVCRMKVVRLEDDGIGLMMCDNTIDSN